MIYFARIRSGNIKIGTSGNVHERIAFLRQSGYEPTLLAVIPGDSIEEKAMHARFSRLRIGTTEFFFPGPELTSFIDTLPAFKETPKPRFKDVPKELLEIRVPISIATILREKAARQRKSIAEIGTDILVRGLGLDPAEYGIESPVSAR